MIAGSSQILADMAVTDLWVRLTTRKYTEANATTHVQEQLARFLDHTSDYAP